MGVDYTLESVLNTEIEGLKRVRGVDKILKKSKDKIFGGQLNEGNIEEFKSYVRLFSALYNLMKEKFSRIYRKNSGERYFEHLREVVNNVLDLPNPNTDKILIALAHDSIEDVGKTFEGLKEDYGYAIALGVQAISKEDWGIYLTDEELVLRNNLQYKIVSDNLGKDSQEFVELESIEGEGKTRRNDEYFGHLKSISTLVDHINSIAISKGIDLTSDESLEITHNVLDVKLSDRIHNLSTQWDPNNIGTVRRKIKETKKYFLDIARENNTEAYNKINSLILELELKLEDISGRVDSAVS